MDKTIKAQKGIAFKPRENEKAIATGWVNQSHEEIRQYDGEKVIITRSENNGKQFHDIFIHAGKLFESQGKEYKLDGTLLDKKIFIYFNKAQSGVDYMSLSLAEQQKPNGYEQPLDIHETNEEELRDEIPF